MAKDKMPPAKPEELSDSEIEQAVGGSTGAGAGKVTFNPFTVSKPVDKPSPG